VLEISELATVDDSDLATLVIKELIVQRQLVTVDHGHRRKSLLVQRVSDDLHSKTSG